MRLFGKVFFIGLALLNCSQSFGWGNVGHGTVGEIAERYLGDEAKKLVQSILGPEPLAVSAIYPDEVRSDDRYKDFAPYHFVEIPVGKDYAPIVPRDGNTIISKVPAMLTSSNVSRERKMILLRYLVHVVGDVHQPLHVGNGVDMGANLCSVNWVEPSSYAKKPYKHFANLHSVWDENIIDYMKHTYTSAPAKNGTPPPKRWFGYKELADWIIDEAKPDLADPSFKDTNPLTWYAEARALHAQVYPDKSADPAKHTYCKRVNAQSKKVENGIYDASTVPTLDEAYAKRSAPIIRAQLLKGGIRLAKLLNQIATGQNSATAEKDIELLQSILIVNDMPRAEE